MILIRLLILSKMGNKIKKVKIYTKTSKIMIKQPLIKIRKLLKFIKTMITTKFSIYYMDNAQFIKHNHFFMNIAINKK
jgi:hypothetical protein